MGTGGPWRAKGWEQGRAIPHLANVPGTCFAPSSPEVTACGHSNMAHCQTKAFQEAVFEGHPREAADSGYVRPFSGQVTGSSASGSASVLGRGVGGFF